MNPLSSLQQPTPVYWLSLVNGLLCTVLPVFATMLAVERIGAGRTSLAAMVGPVATIALAYVFLGETRQRLADWPARRSSSPVSTCCHVHRWRRASARIASKETS